MEISVADVFFLSKLGEEILASSQEEIFDDSGSIRLTEVRSVRYSQERAPGQSEVVWDAGDSHERQRLMGRDDDEATQKGGDRNDDANELKSLRAKGAEHEEDGASSALSSPRSSVDGPRHGNDDDDVATLVPEGRSANGILGNGTARQSHLHLHGEGGEDDAHFGEEEFGHVANGHARVEGVGLRAKSGIIIVSPSLHRRTSIPWPSSSDSEGASACYLLFLSCLCREYTTFSSSSLNSYHRQ